VRAVCVRSTSIRRLTAASRMRRARAGVAVDIKKSSYKKLSKLLAKFEKKGVLGQKLVHKQDHLSSISRGHKLYEAFQPADSSGGAAAASSQEARTVSGVSLCCSRGSWCGGGRHSLRARSVMARSVVSWEGGAGSPARVYGASS
jgi:hypothetical protein